MRRGRKLHLFEDTKERSIHSLEIKNLTQKDRNTLCLDIGFDDTVSASFELIWGPKEGDFQVQQKSGTTLTVRLSRRILTLAEFLKELDLVFSPMEVVAIVLTVGIVVVLGINGESNWFEGTLLLGLYAILAIAFLLYPAETHDAVQSTMPATAP